MKKGKSYIGISFIILVFGIWAIPELSKRISNDDVVRERRNEVPKTKKVAVASGLEKFQQVPPFKFTNQEGDEITNEFYKGKVYVVEFFFSTCPTICPIMNRNMKTVNEAFEKDQDFGIASFTINPAHDTPEVLKAYKESYGITNRNWQMLTGDQEQVMALAEKGFNIYAAAVEDAPGGFEHSGLFALVDKNGYVRSRKDSLGNPIVFYRGIAEQAKDELGDVIDERPHQLRELKEDILKLLEE